MSLICNFEIDFAIMKTKGKLTMKSNGNTYYTKQKKIINTLHTTAGPPFKQLKITCATGPSASLTTKTVCVCLCVSQCLYIVSI